MGIHKNVLSRYERNEVLPSIDIARKIADILEVSLDYLTSKEDVQIDKDTSSRILELSKFKEKSLNKTKSKYYSNYWTSINDIDLSKEETNILQKLSDEILN